MKKKNNKVYKAIVVSVIALFCSLSINFIVQYFESNAQNSVKQSIQGSIEIKSMLSLIKDAEIEKNDFILTKKYNHLENYNKSINNINLKLYYLSRITETNPAQQENILTLSKLVDTKIIELKNSILLLSQEKNNDTYSFINSDLEKVIDEINRMYSKETKILQKNQRILNILSYLSIFLKIICIIIFIVLIYYSIRIIATIIDDAERRSLIEDLSKSNELSQAILDASDHMIISSNCQCIVTQFNSASEKSLGYTAEEIVGKQTPAIWHDEEEIVKRAKELSKELNRTIEPGFDVFTIKPRNSGPEGQQWTFIRKDKTTFLGHLTVTCIRNKNNEITGYLGIIEDITQRKLSETLLAASEEKFRAMYENSPDAYLIMELEKGKITDCNHMAEKMLNGTKEQILGLTPDQLSPEFQPNGRTSIELAQEKIETTLQNGSHRFDWIHKKISGELFPCDVNVSLINYEDRKVLLVGWRNMEKQKKAEKELEESKNFLKLIFNNSPSILFVKDKDFKLIEANPHFLALYPKNQQNKIIGSTTVESYNEAEAKEFLKNDQKAFDEGYSVATETINTPDGIKRTLYTQKVRFEDGRNNPFILGIATDITEHESELLLLQQMHIIISDIKLNFTDRIQKILEEGCKYFQLPLGIIAEISGNNYKILYTSNNQNFKSGDELHLEDMYSNIKYKNNDIFYSDTSRNNKPSNNSSKKISTFIGAKVIVNSSPFGVIIFSEMRDRDKQFSNREIAMLKHITQWVGFKIAQQNNLLEKNKLINKLSESNEELERFAFVCSHDLQEPLRMIRSFSEKLQIHMAGSFKNDDKGKKYFHFITNGAAQAQELIQDILTYSSIDNDTHSMEEVNPKDLVQVINANMHLNLEERDGKITYDELPILYGNKTQFFQLFQNLINNGIKYQNPYAKPHVHISAIDSGEYWQFAVKDNGIGIEERHLNKIFDVFQRLNRKSLYPGTGIGLSICKKVVQRHGGKIWVESQKNIGSTFYFTILKSN